MKTSIQFVGNFTFQISSRRSSGNGRHLAMFRMEPRSAPRSRELLSSSIHCESFKFVGVCFSVFSSSCCSSSSWKIFSFVSDIFSLKMINKAVAIIRKLTMLSLLSRYDAFILLNHSRSWAVYYKGIIAKKSSGFERRTRKFQRQEPFGQFSRGKRTKRANRKTNVYA